MWERYIAKPKNRNLKIRSATLDDTGTFVCKGINGFGSAQVNIQLIIKGKQTTKITLSSLHFSIPRQ